MKTLLRGAVAAIALAASAGTANAQTIQNHYAGLNPLLFFTPYTSTNPTNPLEIAAVIANSLPGGFGTRYSAIASAFSGDTDTAGPASVTFTITGKVNKDCSFYAGNNSAATTLDLGTIGVKTGNNENVGSAFEMTGPAGALINTATAGCNFNNTVEIVKSDVNGLVNAAPGGYDSNQFQANIPYSVTATWDGSPFNVVSNSTSDVTLTLSETAATPNASIQQGAWRSDMSIAISAPAVTAKGLVAGTYSGTTTIKLTPAT